MLRLLDLVTPISTYALNIVTGAGLGLGIDYSLLLVSRYREELARMAPARRRCGRRWRRRAARSRSAR